MSGASRDFSGGTRYVTVTDDASIKFGTGDFSLVFWMYLTSNGTYALLNKDPQLGIQSGQNSYTSYTRGTDPYLRGIVEDNGSGVATSAYGGSTLGDSTWHHICIARATDDLNVYIDGALAATNSGATGLNTDSTTDLRIGRGYTDSFQYPGLMCDARVYNRALGLAEVQELHAGKVNSVLSGLVVHLPMIGPDATALLDLSGTGNDGANTSTEASSNGPPIFF